MIVEAVAEKFDYDLIPVLAGDIKDMYLGVCKFSLWKNHLKWCA